MSNSFIGLPAVGVVDKKLDTEFVDGLLTHRQRSQWAGAAADEVARVRNSDPGPSDYAGVVRAIAAGVVLRHGAKSGIGVTTVQLVGTSTPSPRGVYLQADPNNTDDVYVGSSLTMTAGTVDATDGWRLRPSEERFVPIADVSSLYVRTAAAPIVTTRVQWLCA